MRAVRVLSPIIIAFLCSSVHAADLLRKRENKKTLQELELVLSQAVELKMSTEQTEKVQQIKKDVDARKQVMLNDPEIQALMEKVKGAPKNDRETRALRKQLAEKVNAKVPPIFIDDEIKKILSAEQVKMLEELRPAAEEAMKAKKKDKYVKPEPIPEANLEF